MQTGLYTTLSECERMCDIVQIDCLLQSTENNACDQSVSQSPSHSPRYTLSHINSQPIHTLSRKPLRAESSEDCGKVSSILDFLDAVSQQVFLPICIVLDEFDLFHHNLFQETLIELQCAVLMQCRSVHTAEVCCKRMAERSSCRGSCLRWCAGRRGSSSDCRSMW
jgi:hypothetical protein